MILPPLLAWRARLAVASLRGRGGRRRAVQMLALTGIAAIFLTGATVWFRSALASASLASYAVAGVFGALHAAFLLSLVRDMGAAIGHLFQAPDVPLLLSAPVRPRPLVLLRAGEALSDAAAFPAPLLAPILWGYGIAVGAPWIYYVAVPLVMAVLLCFTVLLGFLVSLFVAPRVPIGRARGWIRGFSALLYLMVWVGVAWWNVRGAKHFEAMTSGLGRAAQTWSTGGPMAWVPSAWAARFLLSLASGQSIVVPLAWLVVGLGALVLLLAAMAPRYPESWQRAQVLARKALAPPKPPRVAASTHVAPATAKSARGRITSHAGGGLALGVVLAGRDRLLLTRDANLLWDMGLVVFMSTVLPILAAPVLAGRIGILVLLALVFFSAELGFDLASRALPLERRALPWMLTAPVSTSAHLAARLTSAWLLGWPVVAVVCVLATWGTGLGVARAMFHLAMGSLVFAALVPIGLGAGVFFGQAEWRHPRQMLSVGGRLVLAGILVALSVSIALTYAGDAARSLGAPSPMVLPLAAVFLAIDLIVLWMAALRLHRLQWMN